MTRHFWVAFTYVVAGLCIGNALTAAAEGRAWSALSQTALAALNLYFGHHHWECAKRGIP